MQAMELLTPASRPAFLKPDDGVLLSSYEAEKIVEELKCLGVDKVGSPGWLKQREYLEKLNLQAHYNTLSYSDEFVMAALISFGKMGILVHELIIIEVILYHREACDALGEDALLEVVDYCYRKLVYLNIGAREDAAYKERKAQELLSMNPEDEMTEKAGEVTFACAICALSVLRYLSDYVGELPLCVMARLIDANDVIMATVPLVESPPWQRLRKHQNKTMREKFVEGKWVEIPPQDYSKLTKSDAQAWLILNNLIVDSRCRSKYIYDDFRLSQVLKLRKYLTEVLVDQLPVLKDLQWVSRVTA